MSYMRDRAGRRLDAFEVADRKMIRLRDTLGRSTGRLPGVMTSPPTVTTRAPGSPLTSGSPITSPVLHAPDETIFASRGAGASYSTVGGSYPVVGPKPYTSGLTTTPTALFAFTVHSVAGVIEIMTKNGSGTSSRVSIDGKYVTWPNATLYNSTNDGWITAYAFTVGTGYHHVEVETAGGIAGVITGATDTIRPAHFVPRQKWAVPGASFEESTVVDSSATAMGGWGWPMYLGQMLGVDVVTCAKGGTGYLNPGPGVKMHDRLSDLIGLAPEVILWGPSLAMNDNGYGTQAAQAAQVAACYDDVKAALPNTLQIVCGPTWTRGRYTMPGSIFVVRDTVKAAAAARGLPYVECLTPPPVQSALALSSTLSQAQVVGDASITCPDNLLSTSSNLQVTGQTIVQIGTGATTEVRAIQSRTGTGPYVYGVNDNGNKLNFAHSIGEPVVVVGTANVTGSGNQAAPAGNGNADIMVGSDQTHPTMLGHLNLANYIYGRLALLLDS